MNDEKVSAQLANMVKFIEKEAQEKAAEINDKTSSEYSIEKQRIVVAQMEKITLEFTRKRQQVLVEQRINHSHKITKSRLEILQVRDKGMRDVLDTATRELSKISSSKEYPDLLFKLILQGVKKFLDEAEITVRCREEDLSLTKEAIKQAMNELKRVGLKNKLTLDETFHLAPSKSDGKGGEICTGGVVLTARGGKLVCDNTLDARLRYAYEHLVPVLRKKLFNEPDKVAKEVKKEDHHH